MGSYDSEVRRARPTPVRKGQPPGDPEPRARWARRWAGRLAASAIGLMFVAVGVAAFPQPGGAGRQPSATDCSPVPPAEPPAGQPAELRVTPLVGNAGEQVGRRIDVQTPGGVRVSLDLAAESFVGRAAGDRLVYGQATASGSEIRSLNLESGCSVLLAQRGDIVRSALPTADGGAIYFHTVTAAERADGGVSRLDLTTGEQVPVAGPFDSDDAFGLVFSTQLELAKADATLIVQSCGIERCVTRLLDTASGSIASYDAEHGAFVGLTESDLICFAAEHDRPAELLAIELATGEARVVQAQAYEAHFEEGADKTRLMVETPTGWQEVQP
ncbi:hypothetical protein BH23CHL7_BH23CHL7_08390 [soil metagenome]